MWGLQSCISRHFSSETRPDMFSVELCGIAEFGINPAFGSHKRLVSLILNTINSLDTVFCTPPQPVIFQFTFSTLSRQVSCPTLSSQRHFDLPQGRGLGGAYFQRLKNHPSASLFMPLLLDRRRRIMTSAPMSVTTSTMPPHPRMYRAPAWSGIPSTANVGGGWIQSYYFLWGAHFVSFISVLGCILIFLQPTCAQQFRLFQTGQLTAL